MRGKERRRKVSPLLARLIEHNDLTNVPAIRWGTVHEKDATEVLFPSLAKVHSNLTFYVTYLRAHVVAVLVLSTSTPTQLKI